MRQPHQKPDESSSAAAHLRRVAEGAGLPTDLRTGVSILRPFRSVILVVIVAVAIALASKSHSSNVKRIEVPTSLFIPGGGFAGLFHIYGQLKSIPRSQLLNQTNVCNSAGCLVLVATLQGWTEDYGLALADHCIPRYMNGTYTLMELFYILVDRLLVNDMELPNATNVEGIFEPIVYHDEDDELPSWISKIAIITTSLEPSSSEFATGDEKQSSTNAPIDISTETLASTISTALYGTSTLTRPRTKQELRDRLIQSAWIPGLFRSSFTYKGHMDGVFTSRTHPVCTQTVRSSYSYDMWRYLLDPTMSDEKRRELVQAGLDFGV